MQITKIKKMFQNMISLRIIRLVVKEISERKILVKIFSKSGGGYLQAKKQNYEKISKHDFFANYTIISQNNS